MTEIVDQYQTQTEDVAANTAFRWLRCMPLCRPVRSPRPRLNC